MNTDNLLKSLNPLTIPEDQNAALVAKITTKELERAISKPKTCKSPGSDGFSAEWY